MFTFCPKLVSFGFIIKLATGFEEAAFEISEEYAERYIVKDYYLIRYMLRNDESQKSRIS